MTDQRKLDKLIASLEAEVGNARRSTPSPVLNGERFPGFPQWMAMRKSALSLHPLYRPLTISHFGDGLPADVFSAPIFDGYSGEERLTQLVGEERAARIIDRHRTFVSAPVSPVVRSIMAGCMDARGIRARATVAARLIRDRSRRWSHTVRVASVACGAAGPIAEAAAGLRMSGIEVGELSLFDRDPLALATGRAVAAASLPKASIRHWLIDLVEMDQARAIDLRPYANEGWDVVDILGLFEYLPNSLATDLVHQAMAACRAGGLVVVANMLDKRPQQVFFSQVVQWPAVIQRSVADFVELIIAAGVNPSQVSLYVPIGVPIYVIAAIEAG